MAFKKITSSGIMTIQDQGRVGYRAFGVPVSGAMDYEAFAIANALVGNAINTGAVEMTFGGGQLLFLDAHTIAITGACVHPKLNGFEVPMWQSLRVKTGDVLVFSPADLGVHSYLAVSGGVLGQIDLGSMSTYVRGGLGGLCGKAIQKDDVVPCGQSIEQAYDLLLPLESRPHYQKELALRVVLGPQEKAFKEAATQTFLKARYVVSNRSDRMGYCLEGPKIDHVIGPDILSDGIATGAVQVPGDGQPIVMMRDAQTIGGYTKIAQVIESDLWQLSQMGPGQGVTFHSVEVEAAIKGHRDALALLDQRIKAIKTVQTRMFFLKMGNNEYQICSSEIMKASDDYEAH